MIDAPMQNINTDQKQRGLRMLSLDDGGVRGLSELYILREIMFRLMPLENAQSPPKPCDYFDIIGGAGTGGVIALMLGRLRMPIDLAIEKYVVFSQTVYSDVKRVRLRGEKFKATVFESGMRGILRAAGFPENVLMQEDNPPCRSFVVALPSANMTPRIFRTYEVNATPGYDCTVVQAARATTATPDLFKYVSIMSGGVYETFVGAGLGYSNPTNLLLKEAHLAFGSSQPVACFVSIGAGHPGHVSWLPTNVFGNKLTGLLLQIATNCEELAESFVEHLMQIPGLFYRFNVEQGLQKMALDDWNRQGEIKAHTMSYLQRAKVKQELNGLTDTLYSRLQKTTLGILRGETMSTSLSNQQTPHVFASAPHFIIPAPSPVFTGRTDILLHLEKCFDPDQSSLKMQVQQHCVLHGLGGAGKTQIALEFCHKSGTRFSFIYMINASSKASIEQSLTSLAQSANVTDATPTAALEWLCLQKKEWLLLFDSADDPDVDLHKFFPECTHGNILITSRNEASKIHAPENHYKIGELTIKESLRAFYKASQRDETEQAAANELVQELGHLALAVVQAGSYLLYNEHIEVKQYLEKYKQNKAKYLRLVTKQKIDSYQLPVFATWDLSYQKLNERAKALFMLCSVLHNSKIPISILERAQKKLFDISDVDTQELQDFLGKFLTDEKDWNDDLVDEAIDMLRSYSLVEIREKGNILLEIHSLVHGWAFTSLGKEEQKQAKKCAQQLFYCVGDESLEYKNAAQWVLHVQALVKSLNYECDNFKLAKTLSKILSCAYFWNDAEQLQKHVLRDCKEKLGSSHFDTIQAMSNLAVTLWQGNKLEEAESIGQELLKDRKEVLGSGHPDTIQAMSNLAVIFCQGQRLEEAEKLEQEVLRIRTEVLKSSHPKTVQAMSNLAVTISKLGRLEEAENLQQEVLKNRKETFGGSHSDTLQAMSNLAAVLRQGEKLEEAENLEQEVLKVRKEAFGDSHPDTLQAMSNLASTLWKGRKLIEAENLEREVLRVRTEAFGSSHVKTIQAMSNLAPILESSGKLEEAERLFQEVLKFRKNIFGNSHPDTIQAMSNLAAILQKGGQLQEAENLQQKVLETRREIFGSSHPDTVQAMSNLAVTFSMSGKLQKAEDLQQEVLKIKTKTFKYNHPETVQAMSNLAATFWKGEKLQEAENLQQEVLRIRREVFGGSHPSVIQAMSTLAAIFNKSGKLKEAEDLEKEVLKIRTDNFGTNHPDTIQAMFNLAVTLSYSGKLQEAENLQQEVLEASKKTFGHSHPDTIQAMFNLAEIFRQGGKLEKAKNLGETVLEARRLAFGNSHYYTVQAMANLAATFRQSGKLVEAENFEQEVLKIRKETFGSSHPDTIRAMSNLAATLRQGGKFKEAEYYEQEVLRVRIEAFGTNHPLTIQAMANLADTLWKCGKLTESENLEKEVFEVSKEVFGSSHPDTILAMSNLAATFSEGGKLQEAEKLQQEVLKMRREILESNHPDTIQAMSNLAVILRQSGKLEEAENLEQEVLDIRIRTYGNTHPNTIQAMSNLAATFRQGGKYREAENFGQEVLKIRMEAFGINHTDTIQAMSNLATTFSQSGELQEAERIQQEVLKIRTKLFGSNHPDTVRAMSNLAEILNKRGKLQEAKDLQQKTVNIKKYND